MGYGGTDAVVLCDRDHDHLSSSLTFMASHLAFYLTLFLFFSVNTVQSAS